MSTALEHWTMLDGYAVAHNVNGGKHLQSLPVDRFANYVYWYFTRNGDKDDVAKFDALLWQQDKGTIVTDARSPWSPENEKAGFSAFGKQMGG